MILLDSDHLTVLKYRGSERYVRLTERLQTAADNAVGTIDHPENWTRGPVLPVDADKPAANKRRRDTPGRKKRP